MQEKLCDILDGIKGVKVVTVFILSFISYHATITILAIREHYSLAAAVVFIPLFAIYVAPKRYYEPKVYNVMKRKFIVFSVLAFCAIVWANIYSLWVVGIMDNYIASIQVTVDNIGVITAGVTSLALMLGFVVSSVSRYNRAQIYGIPFRLTHATFHEPISLMVELLALLLLGLIVPTFLVFSQLNIVLWSPALLLAVLLGIVNILKNTGLNETVMALKHTWLKIAVLMFLTCLVSGAFWVLMCNPSNKIVSVISFIVVAAYALTVFGSAIALIFKELTGEDQKPVPLVEIGGQIYFAVMRHSDSEWLCIPFKPTDFVLFKELPERVVTGTLEKGKVKIASLAEKEVKERRLKVLRVERNTGSYH